MELFQSVVSSALTLFRHEFTVFDFTFSLWNVLLFSMAASIVVWIFNRFFND